MVQGIPSVIRPGLDAGEKYADVNEFKDRIGKKTRLNGVLIGLGKGNFALKTSYGLVTLDGYIDLAGADVLASVFVEGLLDVQRAIQIPDDFDASGIQTPYRPGQKIPEHLVLRSVKIVSAP